MKKGPPGGHPVSPGATRWRMRNLNGSQWTTRFKFYRDEIENWDCAKPLWPVFG